jgi:hypothetical protein
MISKVTPLKNNTLLLIANKSKKIQTFFCTHFSNDNTPHWAWVILHRKKQFTVLFAPQNKVVASGKLLT